MTMLRGLLLGSAAGLAAVTGAQAADLPVKAKPVEYVKICSLYGAGFYYIPGTDTCLRVSGHIRAEISFNGGRGGGDHTVVNGDGANTKTRDRDYFYTRARGYINTDSRTQTSFGTLRTFFQVRFQHETAAQLAGAATIPSLDTAIIQWGGFTIGRAATSYMDTPWVYATHWGSNGGFGWGDNTAGQFVAAYTHQFGNGVSGTLSLEDGKESKRGNYNGANTLSGLGVNAPGVDTRGGNTWPEIVGQLRIDQAWGGFHMAGNLVNNHVAYNCGGAPSAGCTELSGHPSDKMGGGVNAAFKFNTATGVNDAFYIGGSYSVGALQNTLRNNGLGSGLAIYSGPGDLATYGSISGGYLFDSVYASGGRVGAGQIVPAGTGQQLTTSYGVVAAFEHGWNAEWRTSVFGGWSTVDYNSTANAILCSRFGPGGSAGTLTVAGVNVANTTGCNFDLQIAGIGSRTFWSPVRDLTIGVEVQWTNIATKHGDNVVYNQPAAVANFKPAASYQFRDQGVFQGLFSVRRFF
jgi:hypothetical protein